MFVKLKNSLPVTFAASNITPWDWNGVDIRKESQGVSKESDSIQYKLISELKNHNQYSLIFDDDGCGEVADVIAVMEDDTNAKIIIELYHCKFSGAAQAGSRVDDLYTVCGQAEKCIKWASNTKALADRLIKRESDRIGKGKPSRYEVGDNKSVFTLKNKLKLYSTEYRIFIVQPGVDSNGITPAMHQVLCSASAYLMDTYGIPLNLICS